MAEYIEREAALNIVNGWREQLIPTYGKNDEYVKCLETVAEYLELLHAADVVPVRHGRWIVSRTDYGWNSAEFPTHCKCSLCGREMPYQDRDNFCPNCGAKMMDGDGE